MNVNHLLAETRFRHILIFVNASQMIFKTENVD